MSNPFTPSTQYPPVCYDADPAVYHSLGKSFGRGKREFVMSRSELVRFNKNPWKWVHGAKDEDTGEMEWGSLIDCLALTPERFEDIYAVCPDTYPSIPKAGGMPEQKQWNWNADHCKQWRTSVEKSGRITLKRSTLTAAKEAVARLMGDERIARLFAVSKKQTQIVVEYRDKVTGLLIQVKMLLDLLPNPLDAEYGRFLSDLKATGNAEISAWERHIFSFNLHTQGGMYLDGANAALGANYDGFLHAVQEQDAPYATARRMMSEEFLQLGRDTYRSALKRYCQCLATDTWPGFDDEDNQPSNPLYDGWRVVNPAVWMV